MLNNKAMVSVFTGVAVFVVCMISAVTGGISWGEPTAGWVVFLSVVFSVIAGIAAFCWQLDLAAQRWWNDRDNVLDRLNDAQKCLSAEERNHERTKRELVDVRQELTQAQADNIADNNTWRKQVSNMREEAYKLATHIEGSAKGLPDEWEAWATELAQDLRAMAGAGGVQAEKEGVSLVKFSEATTAMVRDYLKFLNDMDKGIRSLEAIKGTSAAPHALDNTIRVARDTQIERRARMDVICKALEAGYEPSETFKAAFVRGTIWVTDEIIRKECELIGGIAAE